MADLKTNYVDDVLDTNKNQLRKYQQIQNDDGTVSFVDVTEYTQVGTSFGAKDINDTNAAINDVNGKLTWTDWKKLTTDQPQISIYYRYNSITTEIKVENGTYTTPSTSLEIEIAQLPLNLCPLQTIYLVGTEGLQLRIESEGLLKIKCPNIYGRGFISYGNRITN